MTYDTTPDSDKAKLQFQSALEAAKRKSCHNPTVYALLERIEIEEAMIYIFVDYGSQGYILTLPETKATTLRLPFLQIVQMKDEALIERLLTWVQTGTHNGK